jgi:hypothetical protein
VANAIYYVTNPSSVTDVVDPKTFGNAYFDDEFCHESFVGSGVTYVAPGTPCASVGAPPTGTYIASTSPNTNTQGSLKYKWARITLKQNGTFPSAPVDSTQAASTQVCWNSTTAQEIVPTALGYANCAAAQNAGLMVAPVYVTTALAITPQGSRRIGQYETAAYNITPPPGALALDGPAAVFNPTPSSSQYFANGNNSGAAAYNGPGGPSACPATTPATSPAISTGDQAGVTGIDNNLTGPPNRTANYTGTGPTPSVVNSGSTGTHQLSGQWSSPAQLNAMVAALANGADKTYSCGIGAPCSGSGPYGTDAAPQITYVNGDFNFGSTSGAGVLVVTGTLNVSGNSSFDGLILIVGQGAMVENGGGGGQFNGSIFLANTMNWTAGSTPPSGTQLATLGTPTIAWNGGGGGQFNGSIFLANTMNWTAGSTPPSGTQLATLGTPTIAWNGGGTNGIQYNSCWANIGNSMHYLVVASREEMY